MYLESGCLASTPVAIAPAAASRLPLSMLKSGQLLALHPDSQGGLILLKTHYADFIPDGAAVGGHLDLNCSMIYPLGDVRLVAPATSKQRRQAFNTRLSYLNRLQELMLIPTPLGRTQSVIMQLFQWVGYGPTQHIPTALIAHLAGVLPETAAIARQQVGHLHCRASTPQPEAATLVLR